MIVCTGDKVTVCPSYIRGTVRQIKALPYGMVSYLIDNQWYSDPRLADVHQGIEEIYWKRLRISVNCQMYPIVKVGKS